MMESRHEPRSIETQRQITGWIEEVRETAGQRVGGDRNPRKEEIGAAFEDISFAWLTVQTHANVTAVYRHVSERGRFRCGAGTSVCCINRDGFESQPAGGNGQSGDVLGSVGIGRSLDHNVLGRGIIGGSEGQRRAAGDTDVG